MLRWNNEDASCIQEEAVDVKGLLQEDALQAHGLHAKGQLSAVQELLHSEEVI